MRQGPSLHNCKARNHAWLSFQVSGRRFFRPLRAFDTKPTRIMERRRAVCCIERMNAQADPEKGVAQRDGRLFSNLDRSLRHEKGSVLGASILIAGACLGP